VRAGHRRVAVLRDDLVLATFGELMAASHLIVDRPRVLAIGRVPSINGDAWNSFSAPPPETLASTRFGSYSWACSSSWSTSTLCSKRPSR
jgi:hypothetical protein